MAAANEINRFAGARIDKIRQSSPFAFYLSLYIGGSHKTLTLSAAASSPMVAIADGDDTITDHPASLCMLFRKHLLGSRLLSAEAVKNERVIKLTFAGTDDMGYPAVKLVYAEMMGKYSNIILCHDNGRIIGAVSTSDLTEGKRPVMAGIEYTLPPPQSKLCITDIDELQLYTLCKATPDMRCADLLLKNFYCLSPLTCREIVFRASADCDANVSDIPFDRLWDSVRQFAEIITASDFVPCHTEKEYSFLPLTQYGKFDVSDSFSDMLRSFYGSKEKAASINAHAHDVIRAVESHLKRVRGKLQKQEAELADCAKKDVFRREGDLITSGIWRIKKGDAVAMLTDYETMQEVPVKLDTRLSPAANAQARYKKYAKLKRAEEELKVQMAAARSEEDYLLSVLDCLKRATNIPELDEIRRELQETGFIRSGDGKKRMKLPPSKPLEYTTSGGYTVRVGKNNKQNDALTWSASKGDLWFHVKGFHGSHVILYADGEEPGAVDYTEAAMYAAWHSEKRGADNIPVDYTRVKFLKKPSGSAPGFVTYDKYFTAYVKAQLPENHEGH